MKKGVPFKWDEKCQNANEKIKEYLLNLLVLSVPKEGKPLILYIVAQDSSLGALLAQANDDGKEQALYYLSRRLVGTEYYYSPIEKSCLAVVFATKKLCHYLLVLRIESHRRWEKQTNRIEKKRIKYTQEHKIYVIW